MGLAVLGHLWAIIGLTSRTTDAAEIPAGIGHWTEPGRWSSPDFRVCLDTVSYEIGHNNIRGVSVLWTKVQYSQDSP